MKKIIVSLICILFLIFPILVEAQCIPNIILKPKAILFKRAIYLVEYIDTVYDSDSSTSINYLESSFQKGTLLFSFDRDTPACILKTEKYRGWIYYRICFPGYETVPLYVDMARTKKFIKK